MSRLFGQLDFVFAVRGDGVKLEHILFLAIAAEDDPAVVGREEGAAVIPGLMRELADVRAIRIHHVQIRVAVPRRGKNDVLAVGGKASLRVVAARMGEGLQVRPVEVALVDLHVRIEIPLIAAVAAAGRFLEPLASVSAMLGSVWDEAKISFLPSREKKLHVCVHGLG